MSEAAGTFGSTFKREIVLSASTARLWWSLLAASLVFLGCVATGARILGDPDTQWHIVIGRQLLATGTWPITDTLSHTFEGQRWIAKEWLSQILLATAFDLAGWRGVVLLTASTMALSALLIARETARLCGAMSGIVTASLAFALVASTLVARPHVLVFPVVTAWIILCVRGAENGTPPWRALPLLVLWVNMHAGFSMAIVVAAFMGLEALIKAPQARRASTLLGWSAFGFASLLATLVSPYGVEPLILNFKLAAGNEAMQYIGEWQSAKLDARSGMVVALAGFALIALARDPKANAARILLLVFLGFVVLRHQRFMMIFGLVMPIVAGPALGDLCSRLASRAGVFQDWRISSGMTAPLLVGGLLASSAILLATRSLEPPATVSAPAALAAVTDELRRKPVFNSYDLGGFLILNTVKTFIDGRSDQLFLGGFFTRSAEAGKAPQPIQLGRLLDEFKIEWAIVGPNKPEAALFPLLEGWRPLHKDDAAHVYVRR
jgi:hypothetical protein